MLLQDSHLRRGILFLYFCCHLQDYGKFGIIDMDDKQKLFRLTKRLQSDGGRTQPTQRVTSARQGRQYTNMDTVTAQMKAQMLDGNAALLDLASEPDEGLLMQVRAYFISSLFAAQKPFYGTCVITSKQDWLVARICSLFWCILLCNKDRTHMCACSWTLRLKLLQHTHSNDPHTARGDCQMR